jgi:hypothetical protein
MDGPFFNPVTPWLQVHHLFFVQKKKKIILIFISFDQALIGRGDAGSLSSYKDLYLGRRGVCGKLWSRGDTAWKCGTCELDSTSAICGRCFEDGRRHEGHDYYMMRVNGGCCDCGDALSWRREGFCGEHGGVEDSDPTEVLPVRLRAVTDAVVARCVACSLAWARCFSESGGPLASSSSLVPSEALPYVLDVVKFLASLARLGDAFRRIVVDAVDLPALMEILGGTRLPRQLSAELHLLVQELMVDSSFKLGCLPVFVAAYDKTVKDLALSQVGEERAAPPLAFLQVFSVQLFTLSIIDTETVRRLKVIDVLLGSLRFLMDFASRDRPEAPLPEATLGPVERLLLWRVTGSLRYILARPPAAEVFAEDPARWGELLRCLARLQGSSPAAAEEAALTGHRTATASSGFALECELLELLPLLIHSGGPARARARLEATHTALALTITQQQQQHPQQQLPVPVSFHLPLHRALGFLLRDALVRAPQCPVDLLLPGLSLGDVAERLIRLWAAMALAKARLWTERPTVPSLEDVAAVYGGPLCYEALGSQDLFLLQVCAAGSWPDAFLARALGHFRADRCFPLLEHRSAPLDEADAARAEALLRMVLVVAGDRSMVGMSDAERAKRDIVHRLASEDCTHSQIKEALGPRLAECAAFPAALAAAARFVEPSGVEQGRYVLRPGMWEIYNPFHQRLALRPWELRAAEERFQAHLVADPACRGGFPGDHQPCASPFTSVAEGLRDLLHSSALAKLLFSVLWNAVSAAPSPQPAHPKLVDAALGLLWLGLHHEQHEHASQQHLHPHHQLHHGRRTPAAPGSPAASPDKDTSKKKSGVGAKLKSMLKGFIGRKSGGAGGGGGGGSGGGGGASPPQGSPSRLKVRSAAEVQFPPECAGISELIAAEIKVSKAGSESLFSLLLKLRDMSDAPSRILQAVIDLATATGGAGTGALSPSLSSPAALRASPSATTPAAAEQGSPAAASPPSTTEEQERRKAAIKARQAEVLAKFAKTQSAFERELEMMESTDGDSGGEGDGNDGDHGSESGDGDGGGGGGAPSTTGWASWEALEAEVTRLKPNDWRKDRLGIPDTVTVECVLCHESKSDPERPLCLVVLLECSAALQVAKAQAQRAQGQEPLPSPPSGSRSSSTHSSHSSHSSASGSPSHSSSSSSLSPDHHHHHQQRGPSPSRSAAPVLPLLRSQFLRDPADPSLPSVRSRRADPPFEMTPPGSGSSSVRRYLHNLDDTSAGGVHASTCGHMMHADCFERYFATLVRAHGRKVDYEGRDVIDIDRCEFLCTCRQVSNALLPVAPVGFSLLQGATAKASSSAGWFNWFASLQNEVFVSEQAFSDVTPEMVSGAAASTHPSRSALMNALESFLWRAACSANRLRPKTALHYESKLVREGLWWATLARNLAEAEVLTRGEPSGLYALPLRHTVILRGLMRAALCHRSLTRGTEVLNSVSVGGFGGGAACALAVIHPEWMHLWKAATGEPLPSGSAAFLSSDMFGALVGLVYLWPPELAAGMTRPQLFRCILRLLFAAAVTQVALSVYLEIEGQGPPRGGLREEANLSTEFGALALRAVMALVGPTGSVDQRALALATSTAVVAPRLVPFLRRAALFAHVCLEEDAEAEDGEDGKVTTSSGADDLLGLLSHLGLPSLDAPYIASDSHLGLDGAGLCEALVAQLVATKPPLRSSMRLPRLVKALPVQLLPLPELYHDAYRRWCSEAAICARCGTAPSQPAVCLLCGTLVCLEGSCCRERPPPARGRSSKDGNPSSSGRRRRHHHHHHHHHGHGHHHGVEDDAPNHQQHAGRRAGSATAQWRDYRLAGEGALHSRVCGGGSALFLVIKSTSVLMISEERHCLFPSLYLDEHGEEDLDLKRGKRLFLNKGRYGFLRTIWLNHLMIRSIVETRSKTHQRRSRTALHF